jgi:hypothetical protein
MAQFQDSISECLHHHTFSNMFLDETFEAYWTWILSCSNPRAGAYFTVRLVFWTFRLSSLNFFTTFWTFCMWFGLPHPSITNIFQCVCTHPIDPMGIHLLHCVHDNECTRTHDAILDTFAAITRDVGYHMGQKPLHALPSTTFNSSCWQVDIVFTKDGKHTLIDVVIANPTWGNYLPNLVQLKDLLCQMQFKPKRGPITIDIPLIKSSP